jgi:predicted TPR repeat methyltransferase
MPRAQSDAPLSPALTRAETLLRAGHAGDALKIYRACLAVEPRHPDALYFGGIAALYTGDADLAVKLLQTAADVLPDRADVANNLGAAYRQAGQDAQAADAFRHAAMLDPNNADAFYNLGDTLRDLRQPDEAIAAYRQVITTDADYGDAYINLGALLAARQQNDEAAAMFERAIAIDPGLALAHNNLGTVRQKLGRTDSAVDSFRAAIALNPDYADAHYNLATVLLMREDYRSAADSYRSAIECAPDYIEAHASLGATLKELKQYPDAIKAFRHALTVRPDHPAALRGLGDTYVSCGDLRQAERTYRKAIAAQEQGAGQNVELYDCLGDVLQKLGRHEEAAGIYTQILEMDPNNATALHFAAALRGETTAAPPPAYIRDLFDDFAPRFEETLTRELGYDVPALLRTAFEALQETNDVPVKFERALDLGCGTGLGGGALKDMIDDLTGVDISANMIAEARAKNLYDSLHAAEIVAYLQDGDPPAAFDLIFAADVFVYTGDIKPVFAASHARLSERGIFAFSVESLEHGTYALQRTGRYAHHGGHIEALAAETGFTVLTRQDIVVRRDRGHPIAGLLFVLIRN